MHNFVFPISFPIVPVVAGVLADIDTCQDIPQTKGCVLVVDEAAVVGAHEGTFALIRWWRQLVSCFFVSLISFLTLAASSLVSDAINGTTVVPYQRAAAERMNPYFA